MKKIVMMLMALCLMAPVANAELSKKDQKRVEKTAKAKANELKKEGFVIMGSLLLKDALVKHYTALEEGASEQMGNGHAISKNNGRQMCLTNAIAEYSSKVMSQIKGRSVLDSYGEEVNTDQTIEFSRFYAAYERLTQKEIKGDLQESFTIMKEQPDGSFEFRMFMLLDKDKALSSRQKALRDAATEANLAKHYVDQLSEFINGEL